MYMLAYMIAQYR